MADEGQQRERDPHRQRDHRQLQQQQLRREPHVDAAPVGHGLSAT
jgi:hypothetical protein